MILSINIGLDIAPEHETLIPVVCLANGWDGVSPANPQTYLEQSVLEPKLKEVIATLASDSLRTWGGLSQEAMAQAVHQLILTKLTVNIGISNEQS